MTVISAVWGPGQSPPPREPSFRDSRDIGRNSTAAPPTWGSGRCRQHVR